MSAAARILEPLGERAATLPLALGGAGADLVVPGAAGIALRLESRGGQWVVRPEAGCAATLNGQPLREPAVLDAADVIGLGAAQIIVQPARMEIEVNHLAGNATVAPLRQESLPGDAVVAGVSEIFAAGAAAPAAALPSGARHGGRWFMAAAIAVLLAGGALLFALVPVPLQLRPEGTLVQVDGLLNWHAGDRLFVLPGRRALTFSHAGYRSRALSLQVTRALADSQPLAVELVKLPDRYTIDTGGVSAELLVDGNTAGHVPGAVELQAGAHELLVRAPGYLDYVAKQDVEGGGNQRQLKIALQPATGWLLVDTSPAAARVTVDGRERGATPLRLELDAGLRHVAISAPGRRAWSSDAAIIAGRTLDLGRIELVAPVPPVATRVVAAAPVAEPDQEAAPAPPAPPPARITSGLLGTLLLLPAGKYLEGSERREQGRRSNEVQREVTLTRPFYLAENEVSNAQYRAFKADHVSGIAMEKSLDLDAQAVSSVSWSDAVEFCNWLSLREGLPAAYARRDGRWQLVEPYNRGYRLPTEAEWEYAARYVDGKRWQRYPWGDSLPPPPGVANLGGAESLPARSGPELRLASSLPGYRDEHAVVAPVGSYARSAAGFHDLGGNVSEWTHDAYDSLPDNRPVTDPMGSGKDGAHAIRGANWRTTSIAELRAAWRDGATEPSQTLGFRVARFAEDAR